MNFTLEGDGLEYDLLKRAAEFVVSNDVQGLTCEIGVRRGMGTELILSIIQNNRRKWDHHVCIDPYGSIPYADDKHGIHDGGYNNSMRREALANLFSICNKNNYEMTFLTVEDTEYFSRFSDGLPVYSDLDGSKKIISNYSLVHLDGPHTKEHVIKEINFFEKRMSSSGVLVFDDLDLYDHDEIEKSHIFPLGFTLLEKGQRKASYYFSKK